MDSNQTDVIALSTWIDLTAATVIGQIHLHGLADQVRIATIKWLNLFYLTPSPYVLCKMLVMFDFSRANDHQTIRRL